MRLIPERFYRWFHFNFWPHLKICQFQHIFIRMHHLMALFFNAELFNKFLHTRAYITKFVWVEAFLNNLFSYTVHEFLKYYHSVNVWEIIKLLKLKRNSRRRSSANLKYIYISSAVYYHVLKFFLNILST